MKYQESVKNHKTDYIDDTIFLKDISLLKSIANETALQIVNYISSHPSYPLDISKQTGVDKQKVYYYIHKLERAGIIRVVDTINKNGSVAKVYEKTASAVSYLFEQSNSIPQTTETKSVIEVPELYEGFVLEGKFDGYICVGSPDPHGEYRASTRDAHMGIMLAMYMGSFLQIPDYYPIALDTDVVTKKMLENNLVVLGGPVTNMVTKVMNEYLPIQFVKEEGWMLSDGKRIYSGDHVGVVQRISNPFKDDKKVILIAGNKNSGTLAAVLAASEYLSRFDLKSWKNNSLLVRGVDVNGDGVVDAVDAIN